MLLFILNRIFRTYIIREWIGLKLIIINQIDLVRIRKNGNLITHFKYLIIIIF